MVDFIVLELDELDNDTVLALAGNERLNQETYLALYNRYFYDKDVLVALALNKSMSVKILSELGLSDHFRVLFALAHNKNTPYGIQVMLSYDENPLIRYGIAKTTDAEDILFRLALDGNGAVKAEAIDHINFGYDVWGK